MTVRNRLAWWIAAAALLAVLPWVPGLQSDFGRSLLSQMGIAAIFALSYNLLLGQTGLLSFGHAVYFGLGGYVAAHFMRAITAGLPIPIPFVPVAGALAGLAFGIVQTFAVALDYSLMDLLRTFGASVPASPFLRELVSVKIAQAAPMIPYLLLVLVLIVRPRGLMGTRET